MREKKSVTQDITKAQLLLSEFFSRISDIKQIQAKVGFNCYVLTEAISVNEIGWQKCYDVKNVGPMQSFYCFPNAKKGGLRFGFYRKKDNNK